MFLTVFVKAKASLSALKVTGRKDSDDDVTDSLFGEAELEIRAKLPVILD